MSTEAVAGVDGRYQLLDRIGRGGVADVYLARDRVLDRQVAIKVLRSGTANAADRTRFVSEARILARLSHPALVTLLDVGLDDQQPYLVMEFVDGAALSGPRPLGDVADLGGQVAQALAYAHAAGVVHRDVKPGNVLVTDDGQVRLADFGIARLIGDVVHPTAPSATIGTAAYLAPEQVRGDEVHTAADVYSLGLLLLEAISGECPYPGPPVEAAVARLHSSPQIPTDLPAPWQRLLRRMTADDPDDRPSASRVARELHRLAADEASLLEPPVFLAGADAAAEVPIMGRSLRLAVAAALVVMLSCGALLVHAGRGPAAVEANAGPRVLPSLQMALDDLHHAVADLGIVSGVGRSLERVDRALVERRYAVAADQLKVLIAQVSHAATAGQVARAPADRALTAARHLWGLLPRPAAPTVATPAATPSVAPSTTPSRPAAKTPGHGPRKAKQHAPGKGHQ